MQLLLEAPRSLTFVLTLKRAYREGYCMRAFYPRMAIQSQDLITLSSNSRSRRQVPAPKAQSEAHSYIRSSPGPGRNRRSKPGHNNMGGMCGDEQSRIILVRRRGRLFCSRLRNRLHHEASSRPRDP
jgi:hypothetical protein